MLLPNQHDNTSYTTKFRLFDEPSRQQFTRDLSGIEWERILIDDADIDYNFATFQKTFSDLYNRHFQIKTKTISNRRLRNPWITAGLLTSIRRKSDMYRDFKAELITESEYKLYKNRVTSIIRITKRDYYMTLFSNFKNNTKKLWNTINIPVGSSSHDYQSHYDAVVIIICPSWPQW